MIEVSVRKRLGRFALDVRFEVEAAGVTALFGRSGAGKTSVVSALAGILRPDAGRIQVEATTFFDSERGLDLPIERRRIGYVFQDSRLFPHLTVEGNLRYGLRRARALHGIDFEHVVELLGLEHALSRRPYTLSGGEKQRVALGRAMLAQPRLLLMDEPLASLDAQRKAEILSYIERLRDEYRIPIVYVSHALEEVVRLATAIVLLDHGRVAAFGQVQDIMGRMDLQALLGRFEAGAVLDCTVARHDAAYALTVLRFADGELKVPALGFAPGKAVRARIRARDVAIARSEPHDISTANRFRARIERLVAQAGAEADVQLSLGQSRIWAAITRESVDRLGLREGMAVWVLIKTIALDAPALGEPPSSPAG